MTALVLSTIVPIILLIALGAWLKAKGFVKDSYWQGAERIGYYILLPALFFYSLATADLKNVPIKEMAWVLLASTLLSAASLYLLRRFITNDGPGFTSIFQGGVRFNNFIGVTIAAGLFGSAGVAIAAVANAIIVPTVNILCVLIFAKCANAESSAKSVFRSIVTNPLLVSCVLGSLFHASSLSLPTFLAPALHSLGNAALPLGLLCVGAALSLGSLRAHIKPVAISSFVKFLIMPLVTFVTCRILGFSGHAAIVAVIFQALPTASSAYVMAKQLGGDAPLMANIVAAQTLVAAIALPVMMSLALSL